MAKFSFNGMDELELSLEQLAAMPDDVKWSVLSAGAEVLKTALQTAIRTRFMKSGEEKRGKVKPGTLLNSLRVKQKKNRNGDLIALVTPVGQHPGSKSKSRSGTNAEVAFYLEYGTPHFDATHWMEKTIQNEDTQAAIVEAEQAAYNEWLDSLGL